MFSKKYTPVAAAPVPTTVKVLAFAPSLESYLSDLSTRFPGVAVGTGPSLESQQLDNSAQQAAVDQVLDTLDKYDEDHPHTGPVHVYLLDGQGLSAGDPQGEGTLHALVNAALNTPHRTVAALIPEDATVRRVEDLEPSTLLRQLAESVLSTEGVTLLVGREALEAFLANPPEPSVEIPSTEGVAAGLGQVAVLLGIGAAIIAGPFMIIEFFKNRKNRKDQKKLEEGIAQLKKALRDTYLNTTWMTAHPSVTNPIKGATFASQLTVNGKVPASLAEAITTSTTKTQAWLRSYLAAVKVHTAQLTALHAKHDRAGTYSAWLREANAVKHPLVAAPFPSHLIGSLKLSFEKGSLSGSWVELDADHVAVTEVPALEKAELVKSAKALIGLYDLLDDINETAVEVEALIVAMPDYMGPDDEDGPEGDEGNEVSGHYYRRNRDLMYFIQSLGEQYAVAAGAAGKWMNHSIEK